MAVVTAIVRNRKGINSAVKVVAAGSAAPIPKPAKKRIIAMVVTSGAKPIRKVAEPKMKILPISTGLRPTLSDSTPALRLPMAIPINPLATAIENAARVTPHSLMMTGMA